MVELSTKSLLFAAVLVFSPLLLRNDLKIKKYIFLVMNLGVYIAGLKDVRYIVLALAWIMLPYCVLKIIYRFSYEKREKIPWKQLLITVMLAVFVYLMKYDAVFNTLHIPYIFAFRLLGLSYFLFRQIDYIMQYEVYLEENIETGVVDYINYIFNFYSLLAGPIQRYVDYYANFYKKPDKLNLDMIYKGLNRALNGYLKVYLVSAYLSEWASYWYSNLGNHSSFIMAAGAFVVFAYLNCWYIYFNFSGYCDIVCSFASLAGIEIPENFNRPYLAKSVVEFWNRHHISLSEWIRDYIYQPLFKKLISGVFETDIYMGQYIALFVTFTVAGIWHGTDINYLIYGLFQGLGIVAASAWKNKRKKILGKERNKAWEKSKTVIFVSRAVTWFYISLTFSFVGYDVAGLVFK